MGLEAKSRQLSLREHGAQRFRGAVGMDLKVLRRIVADLPQGRAGLRLYGMAALRPVLEEGGAVHSLATQKLGRGARPVRAILFDKSAETNWALQWHQDRTICVKERIEVPGFGPWTVKAGLLHVAPPFDLLSRMVTVRVHLDDVSETNAPLLIALGSHRLGRVAEVDVDALVRRCGTEVCLAKAGDVWVYATAILHASERAAVPQRRRVLQVDYAAEKLEGGLEWLGI